MIAKASTHNRPFKANKKSMDTNEFKKYAVHHLGMSSSTLDRYEKIMQGEPSISNMTPNIIEERQMRATVIDVFSRLMADRIIFLGTPVDDYIANVITAQLLFLESADPKKEVIMAPRCAATRWRRRRCC
jgi:ATP-dependent Clp protease protease subunit